MQQQVHDLCHPRPADVGEAGEVGLVFHGAVLEQWFEPEGERHQAGDAGDVSLGEGGRRRAGAEFAVACAAGGEMEVAADGDSGLVHAETSVW